MKYRNFRVIDYDVRSSQSLKKKLVLTLSEGKPHVASTGYVKVIKPNTFEQKNDFFKVSFNGFFRFAFER